MNIRMVWSRLLLVKHLSFESRSNAAETTGWSGSGSGVVGVEAARDSTILFHESGTWTPEMGRATTFTNVYRWTADPAGGFIGLEHLRFGPERPVYLFDLACGRAMSASHCVSAARGSPYRPIRPKPSAPCHSPTAVARLVGFVEKMIRASRSAGGTVRCGTALAWRVSSPSPSCSANQFSIARATGAIDISGRRS